MDQPVWIGMMDLSKGPIPAPAAQTRHGPGATIGRYHILRLVGEGGMGAVYEAEQENPRRTVALKVIKPGLAGPEVLRRFEQEAQALGRLQHPGIAQIYEGGTAEAGFGPQPYFAMEFIHGQSLREYVASHSLPTRQRMELMAKICDAVHHAHQRGLIHRDLKPGNILVEETGQPRILDFGVARVTGSDEQATRQTDLGQLVGTLAYMSPEQVLADPLELDTRTDVYALGVILYELLAGRLPYRLSRKIHEAAQTICKEDPARLSSIDRSYRGDIETIVAKALEKEKARRYASAADLAADLRRYLTHEPIIARPPTAVYQFHKFTQRHRALAVGAAAVFVVLLAGLAASLWQAARANQAERKALGERDRAIAAERTAAEERDRATAERNRAVTAEARMSQERNRAVAEKQRADNEAAIAKAVNDFLQEDLLAQASANSQARPGAKPDPDLKVRTALDRAAAKIEGKFGTQPLVEAAIRQTISNTYIDLGLFAGAEQQLVRVLELRRRVLGAEHPETLTSQDELGSLYYKLGKYAQAAPLHAKVLEIRRRVLGEEHLDTLKSMNNLADTYRSQGRIAQAEPVLRKTLEIKLRVLGAEHPSTLVSMSNLGLLHFNRGDYSQAEPLYSKVFEIRRRVLGEEHPRTQFSGYGLALLYWREGKRAEAKSLFDNVLAVQRRVLGEEHPDTLRTMEALGAVSVAERRYGEAERLHTKVLAVRRRILGEEHPETLVALTSLAAMYQDQGMYPQAEQLHAKALEARRRTMGDAHPDTLRSLQQMSRLLLLQGKYGDAEPLLHTALDAYAKMASNDWQRFDIQSMLGASLANRRMFAEAEPLLVSGYEGLLQREGAINPAERTVLLQAKQRLIDLYQAWGKLELAAKWRDDRPW